MALTIIYTVILIATTIFAAYYVFLGIVALFVRKQKYPMCEDKLKFCIFVPCHNEEDVIAATVGNFAKFNYASDLWDVYFLADNCSDQTADRIREAIEKVERPNFHVLERNVDGPNKKGKPYAINWGITTLEEGDGFYGKYDMFMILDADNFADADILKHINSQYLSFKENKRPAMIQTYLDSKNKNNLIARGYFASYRVSNGFFQLPKYKLGLVPAIGGTGFAMETTFLKELGGYCCTSLVEDLEIQTIATLKAKRIAYNHNARIYDEKPTGVKQSVVQKTRWAQGHWFVFFKYGWRLLLWMFHPKEIKFFFKRLDNLVYLSTMLFMLLSVVSTILSAICILMKVEVPFVPFWLTLGMALYTIAMFPLSAWLDGTAQEKKRLLIEFIPNVIAGAIASVIFCIASLFGLFKCGNQKVWKKTKHQVTVMSEEEPDPVK